jgi:RHS repeat-associated protein
VGSKDYFPYGDEIGSSSSGNVDKFGTYLRDQTTGLDYADQRYFASLSGRFLSSDPYEASGGAGDPSSWNRYPYVGGDPVNWMDSTGLVKSCPLGDGCKGGSPYGDGGSGPSGTGGGDGDGMETVADPTSGGGMTIPFRKLQSLQMLSFSKNL